MLKFATLFAVLVAASAFTSAAEARGGGVYFATWLRNAGAKQAHERWVASHSSSRNSERATKAAAQASAAKRTRLRTSQKQEAAKRAQLASEQKKATAAKQVAAEKTTTVADAAPKGDLLASATTPSPGIASGSVKTTATAADVCRKYSPAADGLVEIPCK